MTPGVVPARKTASKADGRREQPRNDLPLAVASDRLRGKPGRPRKAESGHNGGITDEQGRMNGGAETRTLAEVAIAPRLLDLHATAAYLGLSDWTVRDLEAGGTLRRVSIPCRDRDLRKVLFDRADLDRLIDTWKDA